MSTGQLLSSPRSFRLLADVPTNWNAADLVIEVLSDGNTSEEMEAKLQVYRQAGVRMIWYINPQSLDAVCYHGAGESIYVAPNSVLEDHDVLPGFQLSLAGLFARADQQRPAEG